MKFKKLLFAGTLFTMALAFWSYTSFDKASNSENLTEANVQTNLITLDRAQMLYDNYKENRVNLIKTQGEQDNMKSNFGNSQYVEWDIETIENYLEFVKKEAANANANVESIRIYVGQYGSDEEHESNETMFWVPTTKIDGANRGFYVSGNKAKTIANRFDENNEETQSLIMNFGSCCTKDDFATAEAIY